MYYLASAFALSMLPGPARLSADPLNLTSPYDFIHLGEYLADHKTHSVVGHAATAAYMQQRLGIPVETNRQEIKLDYGDSIYICQIGVRLSEGQVLTLEELEDIPVSFWVVTVMRQ